MRQVVLALALALTLLLTVTPGLVAAAPRDTDRKDVTDLGSAAEEAELAAFLSAACGFPITAEVKGWVMSMDIPAQGGGHQPVHRDIYHISSTVLTSASGSITFSNDIGPDFFFVEDGVLKVAITGRSLTGSGVIGRVVVNLETGVIEQESGRRLYADFVAVVCEELAPTA